VREVRRTAALRCLLRESLVNCHLKILWIFQLCVPIDQAFVNSLINRSSERKLRYGRFLKLWFLPSSDDRVCFFKFFIMLIIFRIDKLLIINVSVLAIVDATAYLRLCCWALFIVLLKILRFEKLALFRRRWVVSLKLSGWGLLIFICCCHALLTFRVA
jgi:hypothetical protein